MKNLLLTFIFSILLSSCGNRKAGTLLANDTIKASEVISDFIIKKDTFDFAIDGDLRKVAYFKDKYYCMFQTKGKYGLLSFKKMVILDKNGKFIESVLVPKGMWKMKQYDIRIENDSLFLQRENSAKGSFVLGEYGTTFKSTESRELKIYEDEHYNVFSTCKGEWGGTIFFQDKRTNELYEGSSTCPIVVNKIENEYFVTNYMGHMYGFTSVNKISDPRKLKKSEWNFKRPIGSSEFKGVEQVLDTMEFYIPTSFVKNDKLLHIYNDDNGTYISEIENKKMKPIYTFDFRFKPQFNQQLTNHKQVLTFKVVESGKDGILIIDGKNLNFNFLR